jgi:hypothetical protein
MLFISAAYVALSLLLPVDRSILANNLQLDVSREADRLAESVRILKEEKFLDPQRADALQEKIEQVKAAAKGNDPAKTLEALDTLNALVQQSARLAAEQSARQAGQLDKVDTAAMAVQKAADGLDEKTLKDLLSDLAELAQKAADENEAFREALDGETVEALSKGTLSLEQLGKLSSSSRMSKESLQRAAERLKNAKLIDSEKLKEFKGKCDSDSLAEYLKKSGCKGCLNQAMEGPSDGFGRGGVDEGGGPTPLHFGDGSDENGFKFREEVLPPGQLSSLKESQTTGVSKTAPRTDPKTGPAGSGALEGATAGGGSSTAGQVLPQHKAAVDRYFDRSPKK